MSRREIVGRLAPSPTGALHLGHASSFLAAWWSARAAGGRVLLRLEDVDAARASDDHVTAALADLKWLGLDWDGPPIVQSERLPTLRSAAEKLLIQGQAYPCVCTRGDLARAHATEETPGAPHAGSPEQRYPGTCRGLFVDLEEAEDTTHKEAGLRMRVPPGTLSFDDLVYGPQAFDVAADVGDFLILRRDKTPAYQLAIVVDDAQDGVTQVVRGSDLLSSTARQIHVSRALGYDLPQYLHVPLVCDHTGRRLAKRESALSLSELRKGGLAPGAIVSWVARCFGMSTSRSHETARTYVDRFSPERITRDDILLPENTRDAF